MSGSREVRALVLIDGTTSRDRWKSPRLVAIATGWLGINNDETHKTITMARRKPDVSLGSLESASTEQPYCRRGKPRIRISYPTLKQWIYRGKLQTVKTRRASPRAGGEIDRLIPKSGTRRSHIAAN
jgi:hypothetical protein